MEESRTTSSPDPTAKRTTGKLPVENGANTVPPADASNGQNAPDSTMPKSTNESLRDFR